MASLALVPDVGIGYGYQLAMEFTLTFFLIYVIFSVAFDTVDSKNIEVKQIGLAGDEGAKNVAARNLTIYTARYEHDHMTMTDHRTDQLNSPQLTVT